jgi:putative glutamine amidotransferase
MAFTPGGVLAGLGLPARFQVNSIHTQGVDRLAPGLQVEATAPDGLVEAVSVKRRQGFCFRSSVAPRMAGKL